MSETTANNTCGKQQQEAAMKGCSASEGNNNKNNKTKTIQEGSITMHYPADQETQVFYNPVQVQNRDLSVLMIRLYGERRAAQQAVRKYRSSLIQQQRDEMEAARAKNDSNDGVAATGLSKEEKKKADIALNEKVESYKANLDASQAVQDMAQESSSNGLCILDALAASGLRSLRYWNEIPGVHHVTINDLDAAAVERAHNILTANQLGEFEIVKTDSTKDAATGRRARGIHIQTGDATVEMYNSRPTTKLRPGFVPDDRSWDVIDLDPYGSAAPFLDAALQGISNGGLINCTCTDMAALGGSRPEVCVGRYGAMPIQRSSYLQELALRILLQSMAVTAAKYGRTIHPLLSVGMDFYVRVFVVVRDDKAGVNDLSMKLGYVYQSTQCQSFSIAPMGQMGGKKNNVYQAGRSPGANCPETGANYKIGGPMWTGPLHDPEVIQAALDRLSGKRPEDAEFLKNLATKDRLRGLLLSCRDEVHEAPLYYKLPDVSKTLQLSTPPMEMMRNALINAGYRCSAYHKEPQAVKTDAPDVVVWDIMRAWYQQQLKKKATKPPKEGSTAEKILSKTIVTSVDFKRPKREINWEEQAVPRFPLNPPNFGPKKAATGFKRKAADQQPNSEG